MLTPPPSYQIFLKVNDKKVDFKNIKDTLNAPLEGRIDSIEIIKENNFNSEIKNIFVFNGTKIDRFDAFEGKIFKIPDTVKFNKKSKSLNFYSHLNVFVLGLLSLFSGNYIFFPFYILFFAAYLYYLKNKSEIKLPKINFQITATGVILFGFLIRLNGFLDYFPWGDEIASFVYSENTFADPGNPPLFYIVLKFIFKYFGTSLFTLRILPFVAGILTIVFGMYFLYKNCDRKTSITFGLLSSINIPLVYYSLEGRSYSLQTLITVLFAFMVFKIISKPKVKYFLLYCFLVALSVNLHFYEFILIFANYLFVSIIFIKEKQYKNLLLLRLPIQQALYFFSHTCLELLPKEAFVPNLILGFLILIIINLRYV